MRSSSLWPKWFHFSAPLARQDHSPYEGGRGPMPLPLAHFEWGMDKMDIMGWTFGHFTLMNVDILWTMFLLHFQWTKVMALWILWSNGNGSIWMRNGQIGHHGMDFWTLYPYEFRHFMDNVFASFPLDKSYGLMNLVVQWQWLNLNEEWTNWTSWDGLFDTLP